MTLILKQLFGFLKVLNSDVGEKPIAWGLVCGMFIGFSPGFSPQVFLIFLVLFLFRIQFGAAMISSFFFAILSFLLDPLFNIVGGKVLEIDMMKGLYTTLFNLPLVPFTKFNYSIVMGAAVMSILLTPFVYLVGKKVIFKYRKEILTRFKNTKFWKAVKATGLYKWYVKYDEFYG